MKKTFKKPLIFAVFSLVFTIAYGNGKGGLLTPASIVSWSLIPSNIMRMVINAPDDASNYYPKHTSDLVDGTWSGAAHSIDGSFPFITTNLAYSTPEGSNEVIYVQVGDVAGFLGIGEE